MPRVGAHVEFRGVKDLCAKEERIMPIRLMRNSISILLVLIFRFMIYHYQFSLSQHLPWMYPLGFAGFLVSLKLLPLTGRHLQDN